MSDAVNSAMSVFFTQSQSFLAHHQELRKRRKGKKNLHTLFEVENVPTDNRGFGRCSTHWNQQNSHLSTKVWQQLARMGGLQPYQTSLGTRLIALDGMTCYHFVKHDRMRPLLDTDGKSHKRDHPLLPCNGVTPDGAPDVSHVLACFPEMITPQDGSDKQDCERNAGKRWLDKWSHLFTPDSITYLGDDLFCNQPFCEQVIANNQYFLFVCKPDSILSCIAGSQR
ncbi:MAG: hypothetical protein M9930_08195 [Anaerolineae bacterium]|nr:hypothetical protein [Anaerolineae bacterium]